MKVSSHDPQRFGNERLDFLGELLFLGTVAMTVSSKGWVGSKIDLCLAPASQACLAMLEKSSLSSNPLCLISPN